MPKRKTPDQGSGVPPVIPARTLVQLKHSQLKPSPNNPRSLFDPEPLEALKESIKEHGVLVPLTVYKLPGQKIYGIVDGERRHRCCVALADEGVDVPMPANVVDAPDSKAGLIYMFNIHQFREQWELMPTAKALQTLIEDLETDDVAELKQVTGLSEKQIDRCKIILSYPVKYQELSMDADPVERIPSNFWVELHPVLEKADEKIPKVVEEISRDGITEKLVGEISKPEDQERDPLPTNHGGVRCFD